MTNIPPPPCNPDVFKNGVGLCVIDARVLRFSEDARALYREGDPLPEGVIAVDTSGL